MKFRNGVFQLCPYCMAPRSHIEYFPLGRRFFQNDYVKDARGHRFLCGCVITEAAIDKYDKSDSPGGIFVAVDKPCKEAMIVLSRALYAVVKKHDLATITSFAACDKMAIEAGNVTAAMIHRAIRNSSMLQDNWRLPPIPCLESHKSI